MARPIPGRIPTRKQANGKITVRYDLVPPKRKVGRPNGYQGAFSKTTYYARALGKTDSQIAEQLGVSPFTFYEWLKEIPEFKKAYDKGKYELDDIASKALFHKLQPRKLVREETKEYLDKFGNVQQLKSKVVQETDIDVLALNNYLNRTIPKFKADQLEDPNSSKIDALLTVLATVVPGRVKNALAQAEAIPIEPLN